MSKCTVFYYRLDVRNKEIIKVKHDKTTDDLGDNKTYIMRVFVIDRLIFIKYLYLFY